MATPRSGTKSKRLLPHIPQKGIGSKRGVTFNHETIETSIGGTQTPGRIKSDPLSPMNRLINDESLLNSDNSVISNGSIMNDIPVSGCGDGASLSSVEAVPNCVQSSDDSLQCNTSVSVEVSVVNCDSNKENCPFSKNGNKNGCNERTPVKGIHIHAANGLDSYDSRQFLTPSPNMKNQQRTPMAFRRHTLDEKLLRTPECYAVVQLERGYNNGYGDQRVDDGNDSSSVTVAVRVRPFSQRELSDPYVRNVVTMEGNETKVKVDNGYQHRFLYDFSLSSFDPEDPCYVSQEMVYHNLAQPLLGKAFEGYNTCLFAYGQTGSGKSYSIMGHGEDTGIIPRFCEELFSRADCVRNLDQVKIHVEISFFEIYNEKIHDLLASVNKEKKTKKTTLRVREHPVLGPYVEGLSTFVVNSFDDVKGWITLGNKNRATAATGMNDKSSRSHSVFTIVLTQTKTEVLEGQEHDHSITSKINLVDLAGSERQSHARTTGERLREGANINKSLLTLGKVISQLAEQSNMSNKRKEIFIPYRDSLLTWLLKESLGGNSKTAMIATISPANHHADETLSTLRYAQTARSIVNIARVNEDPKARLIRDLRAEIERLRASGLSGNEEVTTACMMEITSLKDRLKEKEREMEEITKSWQERLRLSEERKLQEAKQLEKAGITLKVDNRLPNLVNLNEDPQLSEMLLYNIKEGETSVGRMGTNSTHDIQLNGALIADNHCSISNINTEVTLKPLGDAPTYVNGNLITEDTVLHHGDRVILGGDHYFRFNHPIEVQRNKKNKSTNQNQEIKDFEFAQAELMRVQEARYQEARQTGQEEMLVEVEKAKKDAEEKLADLEKLKLQREENTEKMKEQEDTINKLKKQKMMLEQEIIVGRKRQQRESEAALKASSQAVNGNCQSGDSKICKLLMARLEQESKYLAELKERRNNLDLNNKKRYKSPTPQVVEVSTGKMDLYKIALQVREANKISQYLKKNTTFSREDYLEDDVTKTVIKVVNTKLNVFTHWSLSKFEDKLIQMRDIYQNEFDSNDNDDNVFNDPEDQWGKDSSVLMSPISPKNGERKSLTSPGLRQALLSSVSSINSSWYKPGSVPAAASLCKDIMNVTLSSMKSSSIEESVADKVLHCCYGIRSCLNQAENIPVSMETNNNIGASRTDLLQVTCIQMTTNYHLLLNNTTIWTSMFHSLQSALIQDLLSKINDHVKNMGNHIVRFMQGCEGDIDSLMEESISRISGCIDNVCKLAGELALATDTVMIYFDTTSTETSENDTVTTDISQSFFKGCDIFIDKTLQGALRTIVEFEIKAQEFVDLGNSTNILGEIPKYVEVCITECKALIECQELQCKLDVSSIEKSLTHGTVHYCNNDYRRCQSLVSHVSSLVEGIHLLIQYTEPVVYGKDYDLRKLLKCSEMVRKYAENVTVVSVQDVNSNNQKKKSDEINDENFDDTVVEQIQLILVEITQTVDSLVDSIQRVMEQDRVSSAATPRGKRLLPAPGSGPVRNVSKVRGEES